MTTSLKYEELIEKFINQFPELLAVDLVSLIETATQKVVKKGEVFIPRSSNYRGLAFIQTGLIRTSHSNQKGEDITVWFRKENDFIVSYDTILYDRVSRFDYIAVEETVLFETHFDAFMEIVNANPLYIEVKDRIVWTILAEVVQHSESFILMNPEERFLHFFNEYPQLLQRMPAKHIATYLGMTPVSLSRIRRRTLKD